MDAPTDARKTPTWQFWAYILVSPIAAGAAAIGGGLIGREIGLGVALSLLAVIYAVFLAEEPAIRLMPAARRTAWVLAGLAISTAVVLAAFLAFLAFAFATWE